MEGGGIEARGWVEEFELLSGRVTWDGPEGLLFLVGRMRAEETPQGPCCPPAPPSFLLPPPLVSPTFSSGLCLSGTSAVPAQNFLTLEVFPQLSCPPKV